MSAQPASAPRHSFSHKRGQLLIDRNCVDAMSGKPFGIIEARSLTVNL